MLSALLAPLVVLPSLAAPAPAIEEEWPEPPPVHVAWRGRGAPEVLERDFAPEEWDVGASRRTARVTARIDDVAFLVWFEQFEGIDATRVTVAAINGFQGAGPRYFTEYEARAGDRTLIDLEGRHVILPRGALIRRDSFGPQEVVLRAWRHVYDNAPVPDWAAEATREDTARRTSFPYRDQGGVPVDIGPYNFFWGNRGFADSHGGWGIGPFHGGPDDWLKFASGRRNREAEMLLEFQRPIWMLTGDFEPLVLQVPYWMGRTKQHDPDGYRYQLDDWCPYAETLARYEFADYTHLSRGTSGAAAVAPWDAFGVLCMRMVLADFKTANSLTRVVGNDEDGDPIPHPGATQDNRLLYPLWKKLEIADGPTSGFGDRGLAHWLRLVRWCRPFVPREELEPWEDALRELVRKLADDYGVTSARDKPGWVVKESGPLTAPLEPPICTTFHQQLVTYECMRFGGLDEIGAAGARFLTRRPPKYFEVRPGEPDDTVLDRRHTADEHQEKPLWAYEAYGNFTHDVLNGFEDPARFLQVMESRGVNGSSQELDNTPRAVWEPGLE